MSDQQKPRRRPRTRKPVPFPELDAPLGEVIQFKAKSLIQNTLKLHSLDNEAASEITGISRRKFEDWFKAPPHGRNITLADLFTFIQKINECERLRPLGLHGRRCNYVELFTEGYRYTPYERKLGGGKISFPSRSK